MRSCLTAGEDVASLAAAHRRQQQQQQQQQQQLQERRRLRRLGTTSTPTAVSASSSSRIPAFSASASASTSVSTASSKRRPRPATAASASHTTTPSRIPSVQKRPASASASNHASNHHATTGTPTTTPGDRLLSALKDLEDHLDIDDDDDDNSNSSMSEIFQSAAPFVAPQEHEQEGGQQQQQQQQSSNDNNTNQEERCLTPTGPLMEKLDDLTRTWSGMKMKTKTTTTTGSNTPVTRQQQQQRQILLASPTRSSSHDRQTRTRRRPGRHDRRHHHHQGMGDEESVGDSTISTTSSGAESVFDRLYRMGRESAEKKERERLEQQEKEVEELYFMSNSSPRATSAATAAATTPSRRRLSYTPKMVLGSPSTSRSLRKNRLSAYAASQSVASRTSSSSSKIPRLQVLVPSSRAAPHDDDNDNDDNQSMASRQSALSSTTSMGESSVFERLHRNEKRSERLWSTPTAFTPTKSKKPPTTPLASTTTTTTTTGTRQTRIPSAFSSTTKKQRRVKGVSSSSIPVPTPQNNKTSTTKRIVGGGAGRGGSMTTPSHLPPRSSSSATDSIHEALDFLEDLLLLDSPGASSSPRTTTTTAYGSTEEDYDYDDETATTTTRTRTIQGHDQDAHHDQHHDHHHHPSLTATTTTMAMPQQRSSREILQSHTATTTATASTTCNAEEEEEDADHDDSLVQPINIGNTAMGETTVPKQTTTLEQDLAEIDQIGRELLSGDDSSQVQELVIDTATTTTTLEEDLEEIEQLGKELRGQEYDDNENDLLLVSPNSLLPPPTPTTLEEDMAEIEEIGKELRGESFSSRHSNSVRSRTSQNNKKSSPSSRDKNHNNHNSTPAVVYLQHEEHEDDDKDDDLDLLEGIEDVLENEFATAPTPRRKTTMPPPAGHEGDAAHGYFFGEDSSPAASKSPQRQEKASKFLTIEQPSSSTSSPPSIPPAASSTSRDSSGFFSLDEKSGGLVLDAYHHDHHVSVAVSPQKQAMSLKVETASTLPSPETTTTTTTLRQGREEAVDFESLLNAAQCIQSAWRRYHAELELASRLVESCHVEFANKSDRNETDPSPLAQKAEALERFASRNLNDDPYIDQGIKIDEQDIIVSWETTLPNLGTTSVLVEASSSSVLLKQWGTRKIAKRLLRASLRKQYCPQETEPSLDAVDDAPPLLQEQDKTPTVNHEPIVEVVQTPTEEDNIEDTQHSLTSCSTNGTPTDIMDLTPLNEHRAAITVQNWFRLHMLEAALRTSTDSQEQLRQALDSLSNSSSSGATSTKNRLSTTTSSHQDNLMNARRILRESFSIENWRDPYDDSVGSVSPSLTSGTPSQQWIEKRAAALAIHNIVQVYLRGLQRYRRSRKAVLIQASWRRFASQHLYQRQRMSTMRIQFHWRWHLFVKEQVRAALVIQSTWRSTLARRRWEVVLFSVVSLQATWRKGLARARLRAARVVALSIQNFFRSRPDRVRFLCLRTGITAIQNRHRQRVLKARFRTEWSKATIVQKTWRKSIASRSWKKVLYSTLCIQRSWRCRSAQAEYHHQREASIALQRVWRRHLAEKHYTRLVFAAIQIQAQWRQYRQCCSFRRELRHLVAIQCFFRQVLSRLHVHRLQEVQSRAAISIQKHWRAILARSKLEHARVAAIMVQAQWKGYSQRAMLYKQLACIIQIQKMTRGTIARKRAQSAILAAVKIQCLSRRALSRCQRIKWDSSATRIQSAWRASEIRVSYMELKYTATMVQTCYRGYLQRKRLKVATDAIIQLQSLVRFKLAKLRLTDLRESAAKKGQYGAAVTIQTRWRTSNALIRYDAARGACIIIQSVLRMWLVARRCRFIRYELSALKSAIVLQRYCRGLIDRSKTTAWRRSSVAIQATWRWYRQRTELQKPTRSAICIQTCWRRAFRSSSYRRSRLASVLLQSSFRRYISVASYRSQIRAIVLIQAEYRASRAREHFVYTKATVLMIQALSRGFLIRMDHKRTSHACLLVQRHWRSSLCKQKYHRRCELKRLYQEAQRTRAARRIERAWRHHVSYQKQKRQDIRDLYQSARRTKAARRIQRTFRRQRNQTRDIAAIKIQALLRRALLRLRWTKTLASATMIQTIARRWLGIRILRKRFTGIVLIQTCWRAALARDEFTRKRASASMIEALFRGRYVRRLQRVRHASSTAIQRRWRGYRQLNEYTTTKQRKQLYQTARRNKYARKIQHSVRSWLQSQKAARILASLLQSRWRASRQRAQFTKICSSAVVLQACARRSFEAKRYRSMVHSIVVIQSMVRMWLSRVALKDATNATVLIQREWRRAVDADATSSKLKHSAVLIQARVRGYMARVQAENTLLASAKIGRAVTALQNVTRGRLVRKRYLHIRGSAILLQSWSRMILDRSVYWFFLKPKEVRYTLNVAARKIQLAFVLFKMRLAIWEMQSSAVILHRCMRGQLVRSAARFALSHMNSSIRSAPLSPVARVSSPTNSTALSTVTAWHRAVGHARVSAAVVIQTAVRRMLARVRLQLELGISLKKAILDTSMGISETDAAIDIQRTFRKRLRRKHQSAVELQRIVRQCLAVTKYRALLEVQAIALQRKVVSVTNIQRIARAQLQSNAYKRMALVARSRVAAAIEIQRFYRGHVCRRKFLNLKAIYWRKKRLTRSDIRSRQGKAATIIQRSCRGWLESSSDGRSATGTNSDTQQVLHHSPGSSTVEDEIIRQHVARVEASSDEATTRYVKGELQDLGGPCLTRLACSIRSLVEESQAGTQDPLPQYTEDIDRLSLDLQKKVVVSNKALSQGEMMSTPVRSNKAPPALGDALTFTLPPSMKPTIATTTKGSSGPASKKPPSHVNDLANAARNLLLQGREAMRQKQHVLKPISQALAPAPKVEASGGAGSSPASTARSEGKARISPVPGESFFEGESKEIPSPIKKLGTEEWNWADEW